LVKICQTRPSYGDLCVLKWRPVATLDFQRSDVVLYSIMRLHLYDEVLKLPICGFWKRTVLIAYQQTNRCSEMPAAWAITIRSVRTNASILSNEVMLSGYAI